MLIDEKRGTIFDPVIGRLEVEDDDDVRSDGDGNPDQVKQQEQKQ